MLSFLRIRGLALLDDVGLDFTPGLNVLTGETGAGKSIIVDALSVLRGSRIRSEIVRDGAEAAIVDAQFDLDASSVSTVEAALAAHGLPLEDERLVLSRSVAKVGRGRTFVQSELTTLAVLAELGEQLVDICSQHEHHSLTHISRHLELLDAYAGLDEEVSEYGRRHRAWREAVMALADLREQTNESVRRADYLRFQIDEIERVAPEAGEYDALRKRLSVVRAAHEWAEFARHTQDVLYEADDAVVSRLGLLLERLRKAVSDSDALAEIRDHLVAAQVACEEATRVASRFAEELEIDPGELERAEERLHELESLRRKHGDVDDVLALLATMRQELDDIENIEDHQAALEARVIDLEADCRRKAAALHSRRVEAVRDLSAAVEQELVGLHMPKSRLEARLSEEEALGPRGVDRCEFLFSANPGEPMAPLNKVASGGELSRVLLAVKGVLATGDKVATYVFDEIDAGVGGAVAQAIGLRLRRAAQRHQVLCITHLPQIAAFADAHFAVEKKAKQGRTVTRVARLDEEQRLEELARMLGGAKVTASARAHARQLVDEARGATAQPSPRKRSGRRESTSRL